MSKGYWIARFGTGNLAMNPDFEEASSQIALKYGGRILVRGGEAVEMEGGLGLARLLLVEFESYEQALAAYQSNEYQVGIADRWNHDEVQLSVQEGADFGV